MQSLLQGLPLETQEFTYSRHFYKLREVAGGAFDDIMTMISDIEFIGGR